MEHDILEAKVRNIIAGLLLAALTVGCSEQHEDAAEPKAAVKKPDFDAATLTRGEKLYQQNCAQCHGARGEGAENWTQRREDGTYPAPPLNGTGHTWHHPQAALVDIIKHGTQRIGGNMPPWKDKLSDQEIETILAWAKSMWPRELYAAWHRMNQESLDRGN